MRVNYFDNVNVKLQLNKEETNLRRKNVKKVF